MKSTSAQQPAWKQSRPELSDAIICDGLLPWTAQFLPDNASLTRQLQRFQQAGIDHISLTVAAGNDDATLALQTLGALRRELREHGIAVARTRSEISAAAALAQLSVSFHFQTATPFSNSLDLVDAFFDAGIDRAILAYNQGNQFADGCHEPRNAGLSQAGHRLVERMDAVGMRVDLTHCAEQTTLDVMAKSLVRPPIFSHSNARVLYEHERNLSDRQLRAASQCGAFVACNGVGFFLGADRDALPVQMARHLAYMAKFVGVGHIGIGSDFMYLENSDYQFFHSSRATWPRGYPDPPWDFIQPEQWAALVLALEAEGFSGQQIRGILGGNYLDQVCR